MLLLCCCPLKLLVKRTSLPELPLCTKEIAKFLGALHVFSPPFYNYSLRKLTGLPKISRKPHHNIVITTWTLHTYKAIYSLFLQVLASFTLYTLETDSNMSSPVPPALKPIAPFITKGVQMEKADPVIAYFCYLWAVQLLLSKELHTKGSEEMTYATQLLEKLEKVQKFILGGTVETCVDIIIQVESRFSYK